MANQPSEFLNWLGGLSSPPSQYLAQPPTGQLNTGFVAGQPPPYQYINFALWLLDQWVQYLDSGQNNLIYVSVTSGPYDINPPTKTVFANPTSASFDVYLPSSTANSGYECVIKNISIGSSNTITVGLVSGTDQIESNGAGVASVIAGGEVLRVKSDGAGNYWVME